MIAGNPDHAHISTSLIERQNLTMRMSMRRFTRLALGFSKKLDNGLSRANRELIGLLADGAGVSFQSVNYPTRYLRIEWLDRREGPLPAADIDYPEMPEAAAFACANGACSVPVFTPAEVHRIVAKVDDR